jgi:hypothetical protein
MRDPEGHQEILTLLGVRPHNGKDALQFGKKGLFVFRKKRLYQYNIAFDGC